MQVSVGAGRALALQVGAGALAPNPSSPSGPARTLVGSRLSPADLPGGPHYDLPIPEKLVTSRVLDLEDLVTNRQILRSAAGSEKLQERFHAFKLKQATQAARTKAPIHLRVNVPQYAFKHNLELNPRGRRETVSRGCSNYNSNVEDPPAGAFRARRALRALRGPHAIAKSQNISMSSQRSPKSFIGQDDSSPVKVKAMQHSAHKESALKAKVADADKYYIHIAQNSDD